jgi:hypothetical protein
VNGSGGELAEVCEASLDFCRPGQQPDVPELECSPETGGSDSMGCYSTETCAEVRRYDSGVGAHLQEQEDTIRCDYQTESTVGREGEWRCSCSNGSVIYAVLYIPHADSSLAGCGQARTLCKGVPAWQPSGAIECLGASERFDPDVCYGTATCLVEGTINELPVHLPELLATECQRSEGDWRCWVESPLGTREVTVPEADALPTACQALIEEESQLLGATRLTPDSGDAGVGHGSADDDTTGSDL